MSFRAKLTITLVLLILPLVASNLYFHYRQYLHDQSDVLSRQEQTAASLSGGTDVFVTRIVALEQSIGQALITPRWPGRTARQAYLTSALDAIPTLRWIAFAGPSGAITESSSPSVVGTNIADRGYFRQILAGRPWSVSDVLVVRGEQRVGFIIATGIRGPGKKLLGVVTAAVNEQMLLTALRIRPSPQTELVLIDSRGYASFTSISPNLPYLQRDWSRYPFVMAALHGKSQLIDSFRYPGRPEMMGAMIPISSIGWAAGAFVPRDVVLEPVRSAALNDLLLTTIVLIFVLILGLVLAQQMISPVESLSQTAEHLGHGELYARARIPNTLELATLATTMNNMAELVQQRDRDLRRAYERERHISVTLQKSMLPDVSGMIGSIEVATGYFPALKEAEVGGDFYDVILLPEGMVGLVIADVSGKGLSAAARTAMIRYMLEGFAFESPDPAGVLGRVNAAVCRYIQDWNFVTAFFGVINPSAGVLQYANAGHLSPIIRRRDGAVESLAVTAGLPLGVDCGAEYTLNDISLHKDDMLICYTDGVTEARRGKEWFGEDGLKSIVKRVPGSPETMVTRIHEEVLDFTHGEPSDDIALLVARLNG